MGCKSSDRKSYPIIACRVSETTELPNEPSSVAVATSVAVCCNWFGHVEAAGPLARNAVTSLYDSSNGRSILAANMAGSGRGRAYPLVSAEEEEEDKRGKNELFRVDFM